MTECCYLGCHCIKNEQGPSWGQTQHLPPTALPSGIRPPQSMTGKDALHRHLPASPTQQQFPQQRLSTTPTAVLCDKENLADRATQPPKANPEHGETRPKQTLNTGKPTSHQPESRRTPRLILEVYFGQGISCYLKKLNCWIKILLNKNSQRQSTRCRVSCICLPVFPSCSKNDVKLLTKLLSFDHKGTFRGEKWTP